MRQSHPQQQYSCYKFVPFHHLYMLLNNLCAKSKTHVQWNPVAQVLDFFRGSQLLLFLKASQMKLVKFYDMSIFFP
ncbi:hypothetical protein D9M72_640530 [compost metagenome]